MFRAARSLFAKSFEIDRRLEPRVARLVHFIWPWRVRWLVLAALAAVICDYISTYALLELSGKNNVYEGGILAGWALKTGGWPFLFLIDFAAVGILTAFALLAGKFYSRLGFQQYGRTASVLMLFPYLVFAVSAIINNLVLIRM